MLTINPSRVIDVSTQSGSDTTKFQKAFSKACADPYMTVYAPWIGKEYVLEDSIVARRADNDFVTFNFVANPSWHLIDYKGKDSSACFRFFGFKKGRIDSVQLRTFGDDQTGFSFEGADNARSSGEMYVRNCRVQTWKGSNTTGFLVGKGGDDYSASTFEQCEFYGSNPLSPSSNLSPTYLRHVFYSGHRGFVFNNGNNLHQVLRDCRATDAKVAVSQLYNGSQDLSIEGSGGSGLLVENMGTTACNLVYQANGGFPFFARGGRHELGGSLVSHGNPTGWQSARVPIHVSEMLVDGFRPFSGGGPGLYDPGALISLRACSMAKFDSVCITDYASGEVSMPNSLTLAHNNTKHLGTIQFNNCILPFNVHTQTQRLNGQWDVKTLDTELANE